MEWLYNFKHIKQCLKHFDILPIEIKLDLNNGVENAFLNTTEYQCIIMRYKNNMTQQQIADILDISQTSVFLNLRNAIQKMELYMCEV